MFNLKRKILKATTIGTIAAVTLTSAYLNPNNSAVKASQNKSTVASSYNLQFNNTKYTSKSLTINGKTIEYRAYENIVYVSNPVDTNYQIMNIYVPEEYFESATNNGYTSETAPIFFPNQVGGYRDAKPATESRQSVSLALSKGFIVASAGARGHNTQDVNGNFTGKAPSGIVDLKAAVRYLRFNDEVIPGDAEKIIANGTSAGGAMTSLLGATGNNKEYEPYLDAIGAADERDDIFAVSSYCPITNLDNADMAYEWLFNGVNTYTWMGGGTLTEEQMKVSEDLKALFPDYLNSLGLVDYDPRNAKGVGLKKAPGQLKQGTLLTLDADGEGTFKEYVKSYVIQSAQKALDNGKNLSTLTWMTIDNGKVTDLNFEKFVEYATRMKTPPAFDSLYANSWENSLFGTTTISGQHFTQYSLENSKVEGNLANPKIVKMMNPMNYIGTKGSTTSQHWRIRHGSIDRDTSLAIPVILATKLKNEGYNVDFELPWDVGHSGDYDLEELFTWIDGIAKSNKKN